MSQALRCVCVLFLIAGTAVVLSARQGQTLSGVVSDDQRAPLANVLVRVSSIERQAVTGSDGRYSIGHIQPGVYTVDFSLIGYEKISREFECAGTDVVLDVTLETSPLELPVLTVTAKPQASDLQNTSEPVSVLEGRLLDRRRGQSLIQSIEEFPGVSTFSRGNLSMKPVIRGLTSQRVVVAENGVRHISQQWDDEQSPEIDVLDVDRIEVMRGPNSVLFGSDALGGVVNVIRLDPWTMSRPRAALGGNLLLNGFSNGSQGAGALSLYGVSDIVGYRGNIDVRHSGDFSTPAGSVKNSNSQEVNGGGEVGVNDTWGNAMVGGSHFDQEIHISPDPDAEPDAAPAQKISHSKINVHSAILTEAGRIEIGGTWQQGERSEYEDPGQLAGGPDSALIRLKLSTISADIKMHHAPLGDVFGTVGVSFERQRNQTLGMEPLIPGFRQSNIAGFVYEELRLERVSLSAGVRYDARTLDVEQNEDLGVADETRDYTALTGTAGIVWHAADPLSFSMALGRGWRSPIAEELYINGPDEGSVRFKVGDHSLNPEEALNVNVSTRYNTHDVEGEVSVFHNRINRYIFLSPTSEVDSATGFTKYMQRQANATLVGLEFEFEAQASGHIVLRGGGDFVLGKNEETNRWLPMIPAHRLKGGITYVESSLGSLSRPYIGLNVRAVFDQDRTDEFETRTGGYTLFDARAGAEVRLGDGFVSVDIQVDNLFNRAYFDHLSRYKDYVMNPGTNASLKVSVPFTIAR